MSSALSRQGRRTAPPPISWLMELTLKNPDVVSLAAGFTDNASLPVKEVHSLLKEILRARGSGEPALQYGNTQGDPKLLALTAQHLTSLDGARSGHKNYSAENLLITHGSQQLLYIVSECLCDSGDIVLVEDPTYFVFLSIAQSRGIQCRGVRMQKDGLDLDALEERLEDLKKIGKLRRLKFLYLVSYFQNPSGITTSEKKKRAILKLFSRYEGAAGHPIYLVEDAAYRELRFRGEDVPSALYLPGGRERVIYAGTFSKPFATGARVGYGLLPKAVFEPAIRIKGNHDFGTANLLQQLLARALSSGHYHRHVKSLRKVYARKAKTMETALKKHCPAEVQWDSPAGGLYVWARLPSHWSSGTGSAIFKTAFGNKVLYVPGALCYAEDASRKKPDHEMRLSFGGALEKNIPLGIERLGHALRAVMKRLK